MNQAAAVLSWKSLRNWPFSNSFWCVSIHDVLTECSKVFSLAWMAERKRSGGEFAMGMAVSNSVLCQLMVPSCHQHPAAKWDPAGRSLFQRQEQAVLKR